MSNYKLNGQHVLALFYGLSFKNSQTPVWYIFVENVSLLSIINYFGLELISCIALI